MTDQDRPRQNHLLDALPAAVYECLFPLMELVPMPLGEVLYESGNKLRYVYFPTTSIISMLYILENGASAEIAVVGNEGIIGVALFMGDGTMPNRAVVLSPGHAYRLRGHLLMQEFDRVGGASQREVARFVAALYPDYDHPDGADGSLQSASFD